MSVLYFARRNAHTHAHTQEGDSKGECKWESMVDVENESVVQKSIQSKQKSVQIDFGSAWCQLTHPWSRFPYKWKKHLILVLVPAYQHKEWSLFWLGAAPQTLKTHIGVDGEISEVFVYISCHRDWASYAHIHDLWPATGGGQHGKILFVHTEGSPTLLERQGFTGRRGTSARSGRIPDGSLHLHDYIFPGKWSEIHPLWLKSDWYTSHTHFQYKNWNLPGLYHLWRTGGFPICCTRRSGCIRHM